MDASLLPDAVQVLAVFENEACSIHDGLGGQIPDAQGIQGSGPVQGLCHRGLFEDGQVAVAVHNLRENPAILKKTSVAETLDWAAALDALGIRDLTPQAILDTAGFVLKNSEDLNCIRQEGGIYPQPEQEEHHHCGGCRHG